MGLQLMLVQAIIELATFGLNYWSCSYYFSMFLDVQIGSI